MKKLVQNIIGCHQCTYCRYDFCFYCVNEEIRDDRGVSGRGLDEYTIGLIGDEDFKIEFPEWCPLEEADG